MKAHGHYTTQGPRIPRMPRGLEIGIVVAVLAIVAIGLLALIYRFNAPVAPPAVVEPPAAVITAPARPELPVVAANRIFADEILAARAVTPFEDAMVAVPAYTGPVVYALPRSVPELWLRSRVFADEALGALRMPAPAPAMPAAFVVSAPAPATRAIAAQNRMFADEMIGGATYTIGAPAAMALADAAITPLVGPR